MDAGNMRLHSINLIATQIVDWSWLIMVAIDTEYRSICVTIIIICDIIASVTCKFKSE